MTKYLFNIIFMGSSTLTETVEAKSYKKAFKQIDEKYDLSCASRLEVEVLSRDV